MDSVYKVGDLPYCSDAVDLSEYFDDMKNELAESLYQAAGKESVLACKDENEIIAQLMVKSVNAVKEIAERCSISALEQPAVEGDTNNANSTGAKNDSQEQRSWHVIPQEGVQNLHTLKVQNNIVQGAALKSRHYQRLRKLQRIPNISFPREEDPLSVVSSRPNDIVLHLRVFDPFKFEEGFTQASKKVNQLYDLPTESQNFAVLGSQSLCELADKIRCLNQHVSVGKNDDENRTGDNVFLMDTVKSCMFYFGNTLYSDFRNMVNVDYGAVIADWAQSNPEMQIGPFQQKSMEETKFSDLEIRLGYPYVFLHLGDCEHIIIFTDVRLVDVDDPRDKSLYPLTQKPRSQVGRCMACKLYTAEFVVEKNERLPHDAMLFCSDCFRGFHFKKGAKIGEFSQYRIPTE